MKTAISIPDHLFDEAEEAARKLGVSLPHLRKVNNIHKSNLIRPGQRLYAYRPGQ